MTTGPAGEKAVPPGRMRASHADREQVIGALKTAFVQGRLAEDELGARADRVYTARTYAELAGVIADIPTDLNGAQPTRAPWRATKRAWWFEYAAFLPGIAAVIFLPGGPRTTIWTFVILASVLYTVFWGLGLFKIVLSRYVQPSSNPQPPMALCSIDRDQAIDTLKTAWEQGRLTEDEYEARAAQATSSQSRAELDALTGDLPADMTARLPKVRDAWTGAGVSMSAVGILAILLVLQPDNFAAFSLALFCAATILLAPPVTVGLMFDARYQKRFGRQLRLGPTSNT